MTTPSLNAGDVEILLKLRDELSGPYRAAMASMVSTSSTASRSIGTIASELIKAEKELKDLKKEVQGFTDKDGPAFRGATAIMLDDAIKKTSALKAEFVAAKKELASGAGQPNAITSLSKDIEKALPQMRVLGTTLTAAFTVPMVAAGLASVKFASDFEASSLKLHTLSGVSKADMEAMRVAILNLAPAVGIGPGELTKAMLAVTSTGIKGAEAIDILTIAAKASAVGLGDTTDIARTLTSALKAYGDTGLTAAQASEIMFKTVKDGNAEASELAGALGRVIGIASQVGITFDQVGGYLATFTRLGVNTDEAVTALRGTIAAIEKPTTDAEEALGRVGLTFQMLRAEIREKGLATSLIDLTRRFKGNEDAIISVIPNVRALAGVLGTAGAQGKDYADVQEHITSTTHEMLDAFDETTTTTAFKWKQLTADLEVVAVKIGTRLMPLLTKIADDYLPRLMDGFDDLSAKWDALPDGVQTFVEAIAIAFAAGGPVLLGLAAVARALTAIQTLLFGASAVSGMSIVGVLGKVGKFASGGVGGAGMGIPDLNEVLDQADANTASVMAGYRKRNGLPPLPSGLPGVDIPLRASAAGGVPSITVPTAPTGGGSFGPLGSAKGDKIAARLAAKAGANYASDTAKTFVGPQYTDAMMLQSFMASPAGGGMRLLESGAYSYDLTSLGAHTPAGLPSRDTVPFGGGLMPTGGAGATRGGFSFGNTAAGIGQIAPTMIGALQNGGGVSGGVSASSGVMGAALGGDLAKNLAPAITKGLGSAMNSIIGAALPIIGSLAGPLVAKVIDVVHKPEWKKLGADVGRDFGVSLSDEVLKSMEKDSKKFGRQAAEMLHLGDIISADGGLNAGNLDKYTGKLRDVFSLIETRQLSLAQGAKIIDDNWQGFVKAGTDGVTGRLAPALKDVIKLNGDFGDQSKAITSYLKEQLGTAALAFGEVAAGVVVTKENVGDLNLIAQSTFDAMVAKGFTTTQALQALHPALTTLRQAYKDLGIDIHDSGLESLFLADTITSKNPALLAAIGGLATQMVALDNANALSIPTFEAMERTGLGLYARLQSAAFEAGGTTKDALQPMQDYLHRAKEEAELLGVPLDDNLRILIDQSKELGIWKDKGKDAADKQQEAWDRIAESMQGVADRLGTILDRMGRIPSSITTTVRTRYEDDRTDDVAGGSQGGFVTTAGVRYLSSGFVPRGPDTVPAMLAPGEGVVSRGGMARLGKGGLSELNNGGTHSGDQQMADLHDEVQGLRADFTHTIPNLFAKSVVLALVKHGGSLR